MELGSIRFGPQIAAAAANHHLDPRLLAAVAAQETGGPGSDSGNNIVGDGGHGHGLFQIDDRSWSFASTSGAMDPARNADFAAGILEDNLQRYGGDVRAALSAYNSGSPTAPGTPTTWSDGTTLGYADSVLRHYEQLGSAASDGSSSSPATPDLAALLGAGTSADPASSLASQLAGSSDPATQLTPIVSWRSLDSASQQPEQLAEKALGDLIDGSSSTDDGE